MYLGVLRMILIHLKCHPIIFAVIVPGKDILLMNGNALLMPVSNALNILASR